MKLRKQQEDEVKERERKVGLCHLSIMTKTYL